MIPLFVLSGLLWPLPWGAAVAMFAGRTLDRRAGRRRRTAANAAAVGLLWVFLSGATAVPLSFLMEPAWEMLVTGAWHGRPLQIAGGTAALAGLAHPVAAAWAVLILPLTAGGPIRRDRHTVAVAAFAAGVWAFGAATAFLPACGMVLAAMGAG